MLDRVEREREAGERRPEAVVEVAADPATLLLAQLDQAAACSLELLREADGVRRRRDLGCEIGDQAAVGLTQLFARPSARAGARRRPCPGARAGIEAALRRRCRNAAATSSLPARDERDVLEPQRLADRLDRRGQHGVRAERALEPATEAGERGVRVVSLAVHELG